MRAADSTNRDSAVVVLNKRRASTKVTHDVAVGKLQQWLSSSAKECLTRWNPGAIQDSIQHLTSNRPEHRLLYYIDEDARRGDNARNQRVSPHDEPHGGIAGGLQVLSAAFFTGQNNEMRTFANSIERERADSNGFRLAVSTRFPALMADQLDHFGAFLAQAFREHDFYAGVYDGLRSAFRKLYCQDPFSSSTVAPGPGRTMPCDLAWLRIAIDSKVLKTDPIGQAEITRLIEYEVGESISPLAPPDSARTDLLAALVDANAIVGDTGRAACTVYGVAERPLCTDDLIGILDEWRGWMDKSQGGWHAVICEGVTKDSTGGCDIVQDTRAFYHGMLLHALERLRLAEEVLKQNGQGFPDFVGTAVFLQRAYNEQFRGLFEVRYLPPFDANPSTADVLGGWRFRYASHALPYSYTAMRNGQSRWFEWRPTAYLWRWNDVSTALIAPVELSWGGQAAMAGGAGLGFLVMPRATSVSSVSASWVQRAGRPAQFDITSGLFAGVVRIGVRSQSISPKRLIAGNNVTLGIGDANGISSRLLNMLVPHWLGGPVLRLGHWIKCRLNCHWGDG
jgi:hypothetical protein